jgi:hypothetical protein
MKRNTVFIISVLLIWIFNSAVLAKAKLMHTVVLEPELIDNALVDKKRKITARVSIEKTTKGTYWDGVQYYNYDFGITIKNDNQHPVVIKLQKVLIGGDFYWGSAYINTDQSIVIEPGDNHTWSGNVLDYGRGFDVSVKPDFWRITMYYLHRKPRPAPHPGPGSGTYSIKFKDRFFYRGHEMIQYTIQCANGNVWSNLACYADRDICNSGGPEELIFGRSTWNLAKHCEDIDHIKGHKYNILSTNRFTFNNQKIVVYQIVCENGTAYNNLACYKYKNICNIGGPSELLYGRSTWTLSDHCVRKVNNNKNQSVYVACYSAMQSGCKYQKSCSRYRCEKFDTGGSKPITRDIKSFCKQKGYTGGRWMGSGKSHNYYWPARSTCIQLCREAERTNGFNVCDH